MHEPNYADYSMAELQDCLNHVDRDRYPERYMTIQREIHLRTDMGETFSDPTIEAIIPTSVPLSLGFFAWWAFVWRFLLGAVVLYFTLSLIIRVNHTLTLVSPTFLLMISAVIAALFFVIGGTFLMMQVLAKRYAYYRIRIIRTQQ